MNQKPNFCITLNVFGWLSLIGGAVASIPFFSYTRQAGGDIADLFPNGISEPQYIPAIACIVSGIISALIFFAISHVINYLDAINQKLYFLSKKDSKSEITS